MCICVHRSWTNPLNPCEKYSELDIGGEDAKHHCGGYVIPGLTQLDGQVTSIAEKTHDAPLLAALNELERAVEGLCKILEGAVHLRLIYRVCLLEPRYEGADSAHELLDRKALVLVPANRLHCVLDC